MFGDSVLPNTIIEIAAGDANFTTLGLTADFGPCPKSDKQLSFVQSIQMVRYKSQGLLALRVKTILLVED